MMNQRRQRLAWLIAIAFAVRAAMPAGFMLSPTSLADGLITLVICTSSGTKLVQIDSHGRPAVPGGHDEAASSCAYGPPPIAAGPDAPLNIDRKRATSIVIHQSNTDFVLESRHREIRRAREPPLIA